MSTRHKDAHALSRRVVCKPKYTEADLAARKIALPDGTVTTFSKASPEQFAGYLWAILACLYVKCSQPAKMYERLFAGLDLAEEEDRCYALNELVADRRWTQQRSVSLFVEEA